MSAGTAPRPDPGTAPEGQPDEVPVPAPGRDEADHEHWFHALWSHFGEYGPQDVHYHLCCKGEPGECYAVIMGAGRDCGGQGTPHERMTLTEDGPQPAEALERLRPAVAELRQRPGDQPLPVSSNGPSMHDLVADDVRRRHPGGRAPEIGGVVRDLAARKQLGLERYGSLLQAGNLRDAARDLYEELLDGLVYCKQWLEENEAEDGGHGYHGTAMWSVYQGLLRYALMVRTIMDARAEEAGRG